MAFWSSKPAPAPADPRCSFCGLPQREVRKLVAGPSSMICDRCVGLCNDIIVEDEKKRVIDPIELARENLSVALERASGHPLAVRRRIVEASIVLVTGDADACRQLAREAAKAGDPGGGLLALAAIAPAARTPDDAIHEASLHDTLGDARAAIATLDAIDPSAASEATRALLPLHRALLRTSAGVVERDEAERNAQTVTALRARLPSLGLEDEALSRVERDACLVDAHAAHRLGHLTRAEAALREHLLSSERDALAWALLFEVHAEQGQVEHAAAARKRALELVDPASPLTERLRARSVGPFR